MSNDTKKVIFLLNIFIILNVIDAILGITANQLQAFMHYATYNSDLLGLVFSIAVALFVFFVIKRDGLMHWLLGASLVLMFTSTLILFCSVAGSSPPFLVQLNDILAAAFYPVVVTILLWGLANELFTPEKALIAYPLFLVIPVIIKRAIESWIKFFLKEADQRELLIDGGFVLLFLGALLIIATYYLRRFIRGQDLINSPVQPNNLSLKYCWLVVIILMIFVYSYQYGSKLFNFFSILALGEASIPALRHYIITGTFVTLVLWFASLFMPRYLGWRWTAFTPFIFLFAVFLLHLSDGIDFTAALSLKTIPTFMLKHVLFSVGLNLIIIAKEIVLITLGLKWRFKAKLIVDIIFAQIGLGGAMVIFGASKKMATLSPGQLPSLAAVSILVACILGIGAVFVLQRVLKKANPRNAL